MPKKDSLKGKIKELLATIGWRLFIWGNNTTEESYWGQVYLQEQAHKQSNDKQTR